MARVTDPLTTMGARFVYEREAGLLPVEVRGGRLGSIDLTLPVASAQVKSALLLAGLVGNAFVLLTEPRRSRDHSERMMALMGAPTLGHWVGAGWRVELRDPPDHLQAVEVRVPGDFSTAAFMIVYGLLRGGSQPLQLSGVGLNPTRTGLLDVLERMGARIDVEPEDTQEGHEPVGQLVVHPSALSGTVVQGREIPALVDEIPVLAVAAARAHGPTRVEGAGELRVKESDRVRAIVQNLRAIGVAVEERPDGFELEGTQRPLAGVVRSFADHRIEMAFGLLEALEDGRVKMEKRDSAAVSYPEFWAVLEGLGGGASGQPRQYPSPGRLPLVVIDGPAGSGKSSTARALAERLGLRHLDSGALYRALTRAVLDAEIPEEEWAEFTYARATALGVDVSPTDQGVAIRIQGRPVVDAELRTLDVTQAVSKIAAVPGVRRALLDLQRQAGAQGGLVADGRDMGTVVFPDADVKVYLIADLEERARRRLAETAASSSDADPSDRIQEAAHALQARDFADAHREHAPLRRAVDAVVIDTTETTFEEQVARVMQLVEARGAGGPLTP